MPWMLRENAMCFVSVCVCDRIFRNYFTSGFNSMHTSKTIFNAMRMNNAVQKPKYIYRIYLHAPRNTLSRFCMQQSASGLFAETHIAETPEHICFGLHPPYQQEKHQIAAVNCNITGFFFGANRTQIKLYMFMCIHKRQKEMPRKCK